MQLDGVRIGVADLEQASRAYALILGRQPAQRSLVACRFQLDRGAVELVADEPGARSICFVQEPGVSTQWPTDRDAFNGLLVRVRRPLDLPASYTTVPGTAEAIDHVVVQTPNIDRAIGLWRDRLGVRLALDREFPGRGLRLCFFRSGGITLEFVSSLTDGPDPEGSDSFRGVAYRVVHLETYRKRLVDAGVDVTQVRPGHKPGTTVATIRSGTCGIPTLLIEQDANGRDGRA